MCSYALKHMPYLYLAYVKFSLQSILWNVVTVGFAAIKLVIVLAMYLWRRRHVIKVGTQCKYV